jgi:hypothetical protein
MCDEMRRGCNCDAGMMKVPSFVAPGVFATSANVFRGLVDDVLHAVRCLRCRAEHRPHRWRVRICSGPTNSCRVRTASMVSAEL